MVELRDLRLSYPLPGKDRVAALAGVNARFPQGKVSAILGPSGCGKTSLIHIIAGLLKPGGGEVLVDGLPVMGIRKNTAVIFQDYGLLPWKTVRANAELPLAIAGLPPGPRRKRAGVLLEEFGLAPFGRFYPRRLSGGMKQRLAVVRSLTAEPDLLLMDEPFSSLDALSREDAQDFLLGLQKKRRLTIILVTHSIAEAVYLADRIYVMTGKNPGTITACFDVSRPGDAAGPALPAVGSSGGPDAGFRGAPRFQEVCERVRGSLAGYGENSPAANNGPAAPDSGSRRQGRFRNLLGIALAFGGIGVLWAAVSALAGRPFLPGPGATAEALVKMGQSGVLAKHLGASLFRIAGALLTSSFPAAVLGIAAGRSPRLKAFLSPVIYIIHPLPKAAFLPVIMLFLGLGEASKIFLVGFIIFGQILVAVRDAAGSIPEESADSVRSLGGGRGSLLRHVIIPAVLPGFFTSIRVSLGTAAAVLFLAETFATDTGLGYLIIDAWTRIAYPEMYGAITALSLLTLILFGAVDLLEGIVCPWREKR